jgi:hypothetical protein
MVRGRRRARCLRYFSPPHRRPSPAAPQPRPRSLFQRLHRAASLRPAAQASIAVNASLRTHIQTHSLTRRMRAPSLTLPSSAFRYARTDSHIHALRLHCTLQHAHTNTPIRACTQTHMQSTLHLSLSLHTPDSNGARRPDDLPWLPAHIKMLQLASLPEYHGERGKTLGPRRYTRRHTPSLSLLSPACPARDSHALKPRAPRESGGQGPA